MMAALQSPMKHDVDGGSAHRLRTIAPRSPPRTTSPEAAHREPEDFLKGRALFGRDAGHHGRSYVHHDMTHVLDIDPRIARRCLHAGLLQAGV
jgi:hypothetical protein